MSTIKLDNESWDIVISDGGVDTVDGCDEIIQCIKQNINDLDFSQLVGVYRGDEIVSGLIKSSINSVSGVTSINSFSIERSDYNCGIITGLIINFSISTTCGNITMGV